MEKISFGRFYYSASENKPLEWIVIKNESDKMLLICKDCIASERYHNERSDSVKWENCSLRKWLNTDFYDVAFTVDEKNKILDTVISAGDKDLTDKIFLISAEEFENCFPNHTGRTAKITPFARNKGQVYTYHGRCAWYLRNPSEIMCGNTTCVDSGGSLDLVGGDFVLGLPLGVRPAMWIEK